jgi:hypothetical protein
MFLVRLYGFLDMLAGILLFLQLAGIMFSQLFVVAAVYLVAKAILYKGDIFSMIDLGVGVYFLIALLYPLILFNVLGGMWLFFKGFQSLVS